MARPTSLTKGVHNSIVKSVRNGNYLNASAQAVGIQAQIVTRWLQIGRGEHPTRPAKEPFITFAKENLKEDSKEQDIYDLFPIFINYLGEW